MSDLQIMTSIHTNRYMWKVQISTILEGSEYPILGRKGFGKLTPKAGRVSSIYLLPFDVFWCPPYSRGLRYNQNFRGPLRLTNHNFHTHIYRTVLLFTVIFVILTNTEMFNVQTSMIVEGLEYCILSRKGFAKVTPKAGIVFSICLLLCDMFWCPHILCVWDIINISGDFWEWQMITSICIYTTV